MKLVPLTQGLEATVDDADFENVRHFKWHAHQSRSRVYARTKSRGFRFFMHTLLLGSKEGLEVDHINGDSLDNRRGNLRHVTHAENMLNKARYKNNRAGEKGVYRVKGRQTYRARIATFGKIIELGAFDSKEAAAEAYKLASRKYHGEFALKGA